MVQANITQANWDSLLETVSALRDDVAELKAAKTNGNRRDTLDETGVRIKEFLDKLAGIKFSPNGIERNLDLKAVSGRLRTMAKQGHISMIDEDGKHPLYFADADGGAVGVKVPGKAQHELDF